MRGRRRKGKRSL